MTEEIRLDAEIFYQKIQKIYSHWDRLTEKEGLSNSNVSGRFNDPVCFKAQTDFDAFLAVMGKVREEPVRPITSDFM